MKNNFYLRSEKEVLASLGVNIHGLSDEDISSRRQEQGFNELVVFGAYFALLTYLLVCIIIPPTIRLTSNNS